MFCDSQKVIDELLKIGHIIPSYTRVQDPGGEQNCIEIEYQIVGFQCNRISSCISYSQGRSQTVTLHRPNPRRPRVREWGDLGRS